MVKIANIEVNLGIAEIIKEIKKASKERDKKELALNLARVETIAKCFDDQVALDFVKNYKRNLKLMKVL